MKTKWQWVVIVMSGVALAATAAANPPVYSKSSSHASRPAPRAYSGSSDAGYRGGATYRPSAPTYSGRMPTYSSGQRFSPMTPTYRPPQVQNFGGTRSYSGGQRFSSMPTPDATWRQTFQRPASQRRSSSGSTFEPGTVIRSGSGFDQARSSTRTAPTFSSGATTQRERSFDQSRTTSTRSGSSQTNRTGSRQFGSRTGTRSTTPQQHVFATKPSNWQPTWDRKSDHIWRGHVCRFVNNTWVIFDVGFWPWWPIGYPFDYYYGYGYYPYDYGYGYDYGYDPGYYGYNDGYYDGGYYGGDGYADQYSDSPVASAQERLARMGYYHGAIDGIFGPETQRALRAFQRDRGLDASGYLTLETRQALGIG